ncbi:methyl-accepting chemotaxis protein [uncultured Massilia sp.]|uniref:methyl-accepting chemotaxis protein n=1 Tax=uncultured Massilia sp. TaxID=169973 RepID=UPI0025DD91E2|nr:methyl-accepting chemotaxis protein [uncultured Massilia sp.]
MSASITIRTRLIATMAVLGVVVLASGGIGLWGVHKANGALNKVYANQLASAVSLGSMKNYLSRARFAIDRGQFRPHAADVAQSMSKAEEFIRLADRQWRSYLALPLAPDERALAAKVGATRDAYVDDGLLPVTRALRERRASDAEDLIFNRLAGRFVAFDDAWNALQDYQLMLAKAHYEESQSFYARFRLAFLVVLAGTGLLVAAASVTLLRAITRPVDRALCHFGQIAHGNLAERIDIGRADEMGALLAGLAGMQQQLAATVRSVRRGSASIAQAAGDIFAGNRDLSERTEKQAASLQETAASLEQMTGAVRRNADNARHANALVTAAALQAREGGEHVAQVIATMDQIERSSNRIVDIIAVIDGIAFQTNILALNAAVEAARAGEQGRGFAVVATEVRNLAQRAAGAAREVKDLIEQSVRHVAAGTALVGRAGTSVRDTVAGVVRVTDIMADILEASDEQSAGIHQINEAIVRMDAATQQNAALVEQAAAAAGALEEQAGMLDRLVGGFRLGPEGGRRLPPGAGHAGPVAS